MTVPGVASDAQYRALVRQCVHCSHDIEHVPARRGARATWHCDWCGRSGDYETVGTITARIELVPGELRRARPWVQAGRVRQGGRVGR